ncbi:hypothetical protein M0804_011297 [Polistes exclamans]|nr:hypothetical protein M0804_011297 [Polistes exclamans]
MLYEGCSHLLEFVVKLCVFVRLMIRLAATTPCLVPYDYFLAENVEKSSREVRRGEERLGEERIMRTLFGVHAAFDQMAQFSDCHPAFSFGIA